MRSLQVAQVILITLTFVSFANADPEPRGKLVNLGGHRLHLECQGKAAPAIVLENGFDEFSFDWTLVQNKVAEFARVCSYDRAGYAWSDPGPAPRTFDQMNVELHDALSKLGLRGPYVLVGHAFGGSIVRNFSIKYPHDVAGIVFVEAVSEEQRFEMWHKAVLMRDGAKGKSIPAPHEDLRPDDALPDSPYFNPARIPKIEPPFDRMPKDIQSLHVWALSQRSLAAAEENERTWSPEYFAQWHNNTATSALGSIPLIVLTRERGGFRDLDISAAQQESERLENQRRLVALSLNGQQRMIASGEDMQIEAPDIVVAAIRDVVDVARKNSAHATKKRN